MTISVLKQKYVFIKLASLRKTGSFLKLSDSLIFPDFFVFGSMRTTLLYILGELAGGGSVAVAVGVSDPRHPLMFNAECVVWPSARRLACLRQARAVGQ